MPSVPSGMYDNHFQVVLRELLDVYTHLLTCTESLRKEGECITATIKGKWETSRPPIHHLNHLQESSLEENSEVTRS